MLKEIEKMKEQYDFKIDGCDKVIRHLRESIKINRKLGTDVDEAKRLRKDRAIEQAKRQAYVQAKYDFDSLIDYVK
jgi:hypothetical protein